MVIGGGYRLLYHYCDKIMRRSRSASSIQKPPDVVSELVTPYREEKTQHHLIYSSDHQLQTSDQVQVATERSDPQPLTFQLQLPP